MKIQHILAACLMIGALGGLSTSCTNLEEELYSEIPASKYPENDQQAALLTLPMYAPLDGWVDWAGWWFCNELTGDAVVVPTRQADWDDGGKWRELWQHTWTDKTEALAQMWPNFYNGVTACNKVADLIGANTDETSKATMAKVKVMRAYYYYCLIDTYGDVPYLTSFSAAPQKPYKIKRAVIWQNLINELKEAIPMIPAGKGAKTAVNKGMAYALMAKLYLNAEVYTGQAYWAEAEAYCDSILAMGYTLEPNFLAPFLTKNENCDENIFTIGFDKALKRNFCLHMRTLHYNHDKKFNMIASPWNGISVTEAYYDSYSPDDARKAGYFLEGPQTDATGAPLKDVELGIVLNLNKHIPSLIMSSANSREELRCAGVRVNKFEVELGAGQDLSNDYPIFRLADIMLMKAECRIRLGGNGDQWVNPIRQRVGLAALSGCTKAQLLEERGHELIWEAHRRQDLIRFEKAGDGSVFSGARWQKEVDKGNQTLFTIPREQSDKNSNLLGAARDQ